MCLTLRQAPSSWGLSTWSGRPQYEVSGYHLYFYQIGCVIGAIACLASVIGYTVLSDQVNQALKESENQLDDNVGIGW